MEFKPVKTKAEIQRVSALAYVIWHEVYDANPSVGRAQTDYMLKSFQSENAIAADIAGGCEYYLLAEGGQILGYSACKPEGARLFISKIYFIKEARGKGGLRALLEFYKERARVLGLHKMGINVNKQNLSALAAYQKCGFVIIKALKTDIGGGFICDDYALEIELVKQ